MNRSVIRISVWVGLTLLLASAFIVAEVTLSAGSYRVLTAPSGLWGRLAAGVWPRTRVDLGRTKTVPSLLPGPADAWAGGVRHGLIMRFVRPGQGGMAMLLHVRDADKDRPPVLRFAIDGRPAGRHQTVPGSGVWPPGKGGGKGAGYLIPLPSRLFGGGPAHEVAIETERGSWIVIDRIELRPDWQPSSLVLRLIAGVWIGLTVLLLWPLGRTGALTALDLAGWLTFAGALISLCWWGREVVLLNLDLGPVTFAGCLLLWVGGQVLPKTQLGSFFAVGPARVAGRLLGLGSKK